MAVKLGSDKIAANNAAKEAANRGITLDDLLAVANDPGTSKNKLFSILRTFSSNFRLPPKKDGVAPEDAKEYLNFILAIASHKNADAKLIAFMTNDLKKKNPEYAREIDVYEQKGTAKAKK
ncbi:hypothetical protein CSUNSWCD_463 [Campylobacter showae CSUNSWCD]|uniref:Uncharacterized protein n=2 Tax=Campylobacter showae TaxID=204 RepID=M5ITB7_9BACT|nr:hypothetical protein CSUNSWCD_463 [Campylobacter showae CSUNSWCD]